jgi:hypothetical protein
MLRRINEEGKDVDLMFACEKPNMLVAVFINRLDLASTTT